MALAIPELDLFTNLCEGHPKQRNQFVPQRLAISFSGTPNTQMAQDCRSVPAHRQMTIFVIRRTQGCDPQLLGKLLQELVLDIARSGRDSFMVLIEAQLKHKTDPARTIDPIDQFDVIKRQALYLDNSLSLTPKPEMANRHQTHPSLATPLANCSLQYQNMHGWAYVDGSFFVIQRG